MEPEQVPPSADLTIWLRRMNEGDSAAANLVAGAIYGELRQMAAGRLSREARDHSLQPTLLVNEMFLRLLRTQRVNWNDRGHFFATAARMMRRIIVDYFRDKGAQKRPPRSKQMQLEDVVIIDDSRQQEALLLDDALSQLATFDERAVLVVEMRYFGGFSAEQTAELLGVHPRTVMRDWRIARAWLKKYFNSRAE